MVTTICPVPSVVFKPLLIFRCLRMYYGFESCKLNSDKKMLNHQGENFSSQGCREKSSLLDHRFWKPCGSQGKSGKIRLKKSGKSGKFVRACEWEPCELYCMKIETATKSFAPSVKYYSLGLCKSFQIFLSMLSQSTCIRISSPQICA